MKHLVRTIVMSEAYRQSSAVRRIWKSAIPTIACSPARAAIAWMRKKFAISSSPSPGLLVEKFGGPSVKPYQPDGYLATLNFPKREYAASHGDDLYRRGDLYAVAADVPSAESAEFRRAQPRGMHRQPREFEYSVAGPGSAERSHLRGSGALFRAKYSRKRA